MRTGVQERAGMSFVNTLPRDGPSPVALRSRYANGRCVRIVVGSDVKQPAAAQRVRGHLRKEAL